jgi:hypothetical protein
VWYLGDPAATVFQVLGFAEKKYGSKRIITDQIRILKRYFFVLAEW